MPDMAFTMSPEGIPQPEVMTLFYNESTTQNTSNNTSSSFGRNEDLAKIEITVQSIILALAIFGNGTVLLVLSMRKKKLSRMNWMIIHLSVADLFVAFFNVLPQLIWDITYRFYGGDFLCRSVKYFQVVAMYASSYVLITTAVDRYLAICHPLLAQTWTSAKMHILVLAAWFLSLIFAIPQLVIFAYREVEPGSNTYDCWGVFNPEWTLEVYITWITVAIYIVPFVLLTVAYGRICYVVWKSMTSREASHTNELYYKCSNKTENGVLLKQGSNMVKSASHSTGTNPRAHVKGVSRAKVKTVKLTMTVIVCYLLCWGPFFISQMWAAWDLNAPFTGSAMTIIMLLASLNSCTNPWIYLIFTDNLFSRIHSRFSAIRNTQSTLLSSFFGFGNAMVIMMLLASLNSCSNPWIYLAFSMDACRRLVHNTTTRGIQNRDTITDSRLRSTRTNTTQFNITSFSHEPLIHSGSSNLVSSL